jgi:uncharacterized protein DUF5670
MLALAIVLLVLWILGFALHILGGYIHVLLVVAIIVGLVHFFRGKS